MEFVYVFVNISLQGYVLIGESSNYKETLDTINGLHILPTAFEPYLIYKKPDNLFSINTFFHEVVASEPIPAVDACYYKISEEEAYNYLKEIALYYRNTNDLVLVSDEKNNETPASAEASETVEYTINGSHTNYYDMNAPIKEKQQVSNAELKKIVIKYINESGYAIHQNVSFSSLNKDGEHYWSNPPVSYLKDDWTFIANDKKQKKIYLFEIKANTLNSNNMRIRNDAHRKNVIDIGIVYGDEDFTDDYSGIKFKPFLVATLDYNDELNDVVSYDEDNDSTQPINEKYYTKNLDSEFYFMLHTNPVSINFLGVKHSVSQWDEAIKIIMETLYDYNPELLRKIAHMKSFSKFLRTNKSGNDDLTNELFFEEIKDSGIYYCSNNQESTYNMLHDFRKCIFKFGFQGDDLQFEYKYSDSSGLNGKDYLDDSIESLLHLITDL